MPAAAPHEERQPSTAYGVYAAVVLMFVYVLSFLDRQILAVLAEHVKRDLSLTDAQLGFLFGTAFAVFYSVFGLPLGRWADVGIRKRLISSGVTFWSLMTAASGFAGNYVQLALCRFGVGAGEASASPAAYSMLYDYFPPRHRATAISIYTMGAYLGAGIGVFLGGFTVDWWSANFPDPTTAPLHLRGWQAAFLLVGIPGLLMALWTLTLREPPRTRDDVTAPPAGAKPWVEAGVVLVSMIPLVNLPGLAKSRGDLRANLTFAALIAVVAALLILLSGDVAQWIALAIGGYAVFSWAQGVARREPAAFEAILGNKALLFTIAGLGCALLVSYSFKFWTLPLFQRMFSVSAAEAGLSLGLATAIGGCLGVLTGGIVADRLHQRWKAGKYFVLLTSIGCAAGSALLILTATDKQWAIAANLIYVFAVSMGMGTSMSIVADLVPPRVRGTTTALTLLTTNFAGLAIGPYVIGKISDLYTATGLSGAEPLRYAMLTMLVAAPVAVLLLLQAARSVARSTGASVMPATA